MTQKNNQNNLPPAIDNLAETKIFINKIGDYILESPLGKGGMGEVFLATHQKKGKKFAIKILTSTLDNKAKDRFRREYEFLKSVEHENLIKAYDFFEQGSCLHMVLEYVEGVTLSEILNKEIRLSLKEKIAIANKIAQGINVLNKAGIIHRDIKPSNIMINIQQGEVKILDLGIGKVLEGSHIKLTLKNQILGTATYLSPEQIEGKVTKTTDIFSLGVVLYQLFTKNKQSPFQGDSLLNSFFLVSNYLPPAITLVITTNKNWIIVYKKLSVLIRKSMKKNPKERWKNAEIIAKNLELIYFSMNNTIKSRFEITKINSERLKAIRLDLGDLDIDMQYTLKMKKYSSLTARINKQNVRGKKNLFICLFIFITLLLAVMFFVKINEKKMTLGKHAIAKKLPSKKEIPFDQKIWTKCWKKKYFDFTENIWKKLEVKVKIEYAQKYQKWYAKSKGFANISSEFNLGKSKEKITMMLIPPGKFWIGSPLTEKGRYEEEKRRKVSINKAYWLGKYELTQKQWYTLTSKKPWEEETNIAKTKGWESNDYLPVTFISWQNINDALKNSKYSLPTEEQWEYACRAGTTELFYWGNSEKIANKYVNVFDEETYKKYGKSLNELVKAERDTRFNDGFAYLATVGKLKENAFGLHDMLGNVYEWSRKNQQHEEKIKNETADDFYFIRGGCWTNHLLRRLRCANRFPRKSSFRSNYIGCRISMPEFP